MFDDTGYSNGIRMSVALEEYNSLLQDYREAIHTHGFEPYTINERISRMKEYRELKAFASYYRRGIMMKTNSQTDFEHYMELFLHLFERIDVEIRGLKMSFLDVEKYKVKETS